MDGVGFWICLVSVSMSSSLGFKFTLYDVARVTWQEARTRCQLADHILARVDTETDKIWVNTLSQYVKRNFWIGLSRQRGNNTFLWTDSSVLGYSNWADGHPEKITSNDTACVRIRRGDFHWEADNCSHRLNYLCEDQYHTETYVTQKDKEIKGLLLGLLFLGSLLLACYLLLQMPCCHVESSSTKATCGYTRTQRKNKKGNDRDMLV